MVSYKAMFFDASGATKTCRQITREVRNIAQLSSSLTA